MDMRKNEFERQRKMAIDRLVEQEQNLKKNPAPLNSDLICNNQQQMQQIAKLFKSADELIEFAIVAPATAQLIVHHDDGIPVIANLFFLEKDTEEKLRILEQRVGDINALRRHLLNPSAFFTSVNHDGHDAGDECDYKHVPIQSKL